jgi:hypothetical protein
LSAIPFYESYNPIVGSGESIRRFTPREDGKGRPRLVTPAIALWLVLVWTHTRGTYATLQVIFGMTSSVISMWPRYSKRVLLYILSCDADAQVKMPSNDDIRIFINMISSKYPTLADCWGAMDGVKLPIQIAGEDVIQSYFYNGWKCSHYAACLFLFTPDGRIVHSYTNAPGTTHDSTMVIYSKIYEEADAVFARINGRAQIVVDSAFSSMGCPTLIMSNQNLNNRHHNNDSSQTNV